MRNKQEFEQRVYELYELKKKKRISYMKRFTIVGAGVLAAAGIAIVFTKFGSDNISGYKQPNVQGTVPEKHEEVADGSEVIPTGAINGNLSAEEDGNMESATENENISWDLLGATAYMYPSEEKVELNKEEAEDFWEFIINMDVATDVTKEESANGRFYVIEFDYGYKVAEVVYNDGFRKVDDGNWEKCEPMSAEELEKMLEKVFAEE